MARSSGFLGIDIAYLIALMGIICSLTIFTIGSKIGLLDHGSYFVFFDFFPALFFFLNGLTITLTMRDRRVSSKRIVSYVTKRGSILFLLGLVFVTLMPMNMLLVCGLFYFLVPFFTDWNNIILRIIALLLAVASVLLLNLDVQARAVFFPFELQGLGFRHLFGFVFYNGYFSLFPWIAFFVLGMLHGRGKIHVAGILPPSTFFAIFFIVISFYLNDFLDSVYGSERSNITGIVNIVSKKFYLPAFYLFTYSSIIILLNILMFAFQGVVLTGKSRNIQYIVASKYSVLLFHALFITLIIALFSKVIFYKTWLLLVTTCIVLIVSFAATLFWRKRVSENTPVEWLIKRISGSTKK
jgi:uncharacterized protein